MSPATSSWVSLGTSLTLTTPHPQDCGGSTLTWPGDPFIPGPASAGQWECAGSPGVWRVRFLGGTEPSRGQVLELHSGPAMACVPPAPTPALPADRLSHLNAHQYSSLHTVVSRHHPPSPEGGKFFFQTEFLPPSNTLPTAHGCPAPWRAPFSLSLTVRMHTDGNLHCLSLRGWFVPLGLMSSSSIRVVACVRNPP